MANFDHRDQNVNQQTNIVNVHGSEKRPPAWNVPVPSAYFVESGSALSSLREVLLAGHTGGLTQPAGLRGFGGIGKTELALAYAHRHRGEYETARFIRAATVIDLEFGLARIVQPDFPDDADIEQRAAARRGGIGELQKWRSLVILDNVDDVVDDEFFKQTLAELSGIHVIVTCRHRQMGDSVIQVEVKQLDEEAGALYLLRVGNHDPNRDNFSERHWQTSRELVREVDGLPLALHHFGAYLQDGATIEEALTAYRTKRRELLNNRGQTGNANHPDSALVSVTLAYERLLTKNAAAAELVGWCAFLAPDRIPEEFFTDGLLNVGEPLRSALRDFVDVRQAALRSALLDWNSQVRTFSIHRVTQAILLEILDVGIQGRVLGVNRLIVQLLLAGKYSQVLDLSEHLSDLSKNLLGSDHLDTLISFNNLARSYASLGRYQDALLLDEKVWMKCCSVLGSDHPDTLTSMSNLAASHASLGDHHNAVYLDEQVLNKRRYVLGKDHPDTLTSMANLATWYRALGRYKDAVLLDEQALEKHGAVLGPDHPETLRSMNNLACSYRLLGHYQDALSLEEKVLKKCRSVLGPDHPHTFASMNNLATSYFIVGRLSEAKELYQTCYSGLEARLGSNHPETRLFKDNLERCLALLAKEKK